MSTRYKFVATFCMGLFSATAVMAAAPGDKIKDFETGPEMVVIPAGSFKMGTDKIEPMRGGEMRSSGPIRDVEIAKPFAIGTTEVTQAQFREFVKATGYRPDSACDAGETGTVAPAINWEDPGYGRPPADNEPVVCVSWNDARAYAAWLSGKTGQLYRLPTEAEWEYVAKAGSKDIWAWGSDNKQACTYGNVVNATQPRTGFSEPENFCDDGFVYVAPVASFKPNAWGVYDLVGNVWEWVEDCSIMPYPAEPTDGTALKHEGLCEKHAVRGGSWRSRLSRHEPTFRGRDPAPLQSQIFGFRVVRELD